MAEAKKIKPVIKITKEKIKGKCPVLSNVEVFMNNELVATGKLGGDYTEESVLKALRTSDRKRFEVKNKMLFDTLT